MQLREVDLDRWGRAIGAGLAPPAVLTLRGVLGAGKSVLARAVARGAGVDGRIPSPTFNVLLRYETADGARVAHLDLYRLADPDEVWELGWEDLPASDELVLIEWPERAGDLLPPDRWDIRLSRVAGDEGLRRIDVTRVGSPPELPAFPMTLEADARG